MSNPSFEFDGPKALPPASISADERDLKTVLRPGNLLDVWQYLDMKTRMPNGEGFTGYSEEVFDQILGSLDDVIQHAQTGTSNPMNKRLQLRPSGAHADYHESLVDTDGIIDEVNDGKRLHTESGPSEATIALMQLTYEATDSKPFSDNRNKYGIGWVVSKGEYEGTSIFFLERHGHDQVGRYITWSVTDNPPEEILVSRPQTDEVFITTNQRQDIEQEAEEATLTSIESVHNESLDYINDLPPEKKARIFAFLTKRPASVIQPELIKSLAYPHRLDAVA